MGFVLFVRKPHSLKWLRVAQTFSSYESAYNYYTSAFDQDESYQIRYTKDVSPEKKLKKEIRREKAKKYSGKINRGIDRASRSVGSGAKKVNKAILHAGTPYSGYIKRGGTYYPKAKRKRVDHRTRKNRSRNYPYYQHSRASYYQKRRAGRKPKPEKRYEFEDFFSPI